MFRTHLAMLSILVLVACSGVPLDEAPPRRFDIGGQWVLNKELSDPPSNGRQSRGHLNREFLEGTASRAGPLAFIAQDFPVLEAKSMVIEQDSDSMGIRYDNGMYRDISWGERKRGAWTVSAGWVEDNLVIVSRASDASGRETLRLSENRQTLQVLLDANSGGEKLAVVRVFERVPAP